MNNTNDSINYDTQYSVKIANRLSIKLELFYLNSYSLAKYKTLYLDNQKKVNRDLLKFSVKYRTTKVKDIKKLLISNLLPNEERKCFLSSYRLNFTEFDLPIEDWYKTYFKVIYGSKDLDLITSKKEKAKFIRKAQHENLSIVKVIYKTNNESEDLYLDIDSLRGKKRLFSIPYINSINNKLDHLKYEFHCNMDELLSHIDVYDIYLDELTVSEASFLKKY